ncbi:MULTISPECIES: zinc-finger domain-containing protein [unclassified Candidatus Tisiphia]|uniref:zinc-finger domain-containing protein n=1 Tax=unclassified Candidatus Tisiphia TaxID=2996318 RepID=UPI00312C8E71
MQNVEIIETISTSVSCFGKEYPYDHPRIYLEIDPVNGAIMCPYCSKKFVLIK